MTDFTSRWSFAATPVVGVEIPQTPVNPDIGSYGYRSVGVPTITCAVGAKGVLTLDAVDGDTNRANAEVLLLCQARSNATPPFYSGALLRGSGALGSEQGYAAYLKEDTGTLTIIKIVGGVMTELASSAAKTLNAIAQDWYIRFRANGNTLSARAWRYGVPEPTSWDVTLTDNSIAGVGFIGHFSRCLVANNLSLAFPGFISIGTNGETAPRPISEIEFRQWANDDSAQRVILCELGVLGRTTVGAANPSFALFSNYPFTSRGSETPRNQVYDDIIVSVPTFSSRVSESLSGRPSQSYGDLVIKNESGARDEWLTWNCDGRPLTMFVGGVGWRKWDFYRVLTGYVYETYAPAKDRIGFKIRDRSVLLNRKLQTAVIGGTSANAGAPRPITFGKVFNAEAQLKDSATLRYTIHDESLAGATGFTQVRDSGVSVTYTADLANGEFTLSAAPAGRITVDVTVNQSAGSASRAGITHQSALATIVADRLGFGAAGVYSGQRIGSLSAFGASPTAQIGLYVSAEANVMDVLDDIASSAGGFWYFNRLGLFCAALVRVPAAPFDHVVGLDDMQYDSFRIERLYIPSAVEQLGFQRNWTIQKDGVAGSVTAANRALYAAPAQYTQVAPVYSGLDQPSNHLLQRLPRNRDTLFVNQADAAAEAARLDGIFSKPCAIVSFVTKTNAFFYNLGESVQVTADRFGLTEEAGKAGIIVGLDEDFANGSVRVQVFIQLAGVFPVTDTAEPYVTAGDFY
jgi:hypothetical protein